MPVVTCFLAKVGFQFPRESNVKKKSVSHRLPYVRKYNEYVLNRVSEAEPSDIRGFIYHQMICKIIFKGK